MSTTDFCTSSPQKNAVARSGSLSRAESARERLLAAVPLTERRLELAGVSTAVLEGGKGPPIVLLHGPGEYGAKWLRVVPHLIATHRVIAPDLPGHGESEGIAGQADRDRVLAWLDDLIERTCHAPPVLVGQIVGGAIAARFAASRSNRLRSLVLVDSLGLSPFQPAPEFGAALMEFLAQPNEETHDRLWQRCAFDLNALRDRMGETWERIKAYNLDRARVPCSKATQQTIMEQFGFSPIPSAELSRIAVPTALVWGRHDLATPLPVAERASSCYGWPLHVIENAGDDPPMEQPEAFLKVLRTALADSLDKEFEAGGITSGTRDAWDKLAAGYDEFVTPSHLWLGNEGLKRAGIRPGMRFLDVAAGTGALSIPAVRVGAKVLATDQSPMMLERLSARARNEGYHVETRVMDGHALELDDNSFDIAGSQFGVMLFPDMPKGIREMARVVKPGGRVLMNVYGDPRRIEFLAFFIAAIRSARPQFAGPPMDPPPLPFQLQDPEKLRRELARAGLKDVRVEMITERLMFTSGKELWAWLTNSNPVVEGVLAELRLTDNERRMVQQRLDDLVRQRTSRGGSATLTNPINIGIATK